MIHEESLTDVEFGFYQKLIYDACGINFTEGKKQLLISRLRKRMVEVKTKTFREYREYVKKDSTEFKLMLNAISTNKTDFFREPVHFDFLAQKVFPKLLKQQQIRIWCAASSSGEEPYTLMMTLIDALGGSTAGKDIKMLATDISTKVLEEAGKGIYSMEQVAPVPKFMLQKYFTKGTGEWGGLAQVKDILKNLISFRRLNLMEPFPLSIQFDYIFCRNVMIYFDEKTREDLVRRMSKFLKVGGHLFIGNAESLSGLKHDLKYVQPSVYLKTKDN